MKTFDQEKRKFNRVPFSFHDNIIGTFNLHGGNELINAHLLNFSMQGLYFTLKRDENKNLAEGDKLLLVEIKGPKEKNFILNIELEIRRVLDYPDLDYFGYGCHFSVFPSSSKDQILRFLELWFTEGR